jgi:hypothetical protein
MKPTIADLRKFYQVAGKDGHVVLHEGKDGAQPWVERFLSNVNKEANEAEGTIVHLISTPRIDPVYDVMDPFGVDDRALQKNRAVFYNHRWMGPQDLPIGKNMWLRSTRDGVLVKTQYAVGEYSFAADVFRLAKADFLNSYSIGFFMGEIAICTIEDLLKLIEGKFDVPNLSEYDAATQVWYHKTWELFEYSQVGVPMNMDAVKRAMEEGAIQSDFGKSYFGALAGGREKIALTISEDDFKTKVGEVFGGCASDMKTQICDIGKAIKDLATSVTEMKAGYDEMRSLVTPEDTTVKTVPPPAPQAPGETSGGSAEKLIEKEIDTASLVKSAAVGEVSRVRGKVTN